MFVTNNSNGGFRPGPPVLFQLLRPSPAVLWPPMYFAEITQISCFFAFSNFRKVDKFAAAIERPKTKSASTSRWALLSDPVIGSRFRARHEAVLLDVAGYNRH